MRQRQLRFTAEVVKQLDGLKADQGKKGPYKQVRKTLGLLEIDPRHPGLPTREYSSIAGAAGERVWEAYAQNNTPGAYRVFFHYGPDEGSGKKRVPVLTIITVTPHP